MTNYLTHWTPFRLACKLRTLQAGSLNVGNTQQNEANLLALAIAQANLNAIGTGPGRGWAVWRVGENSRTSSCGLLINVSSVPGFAAPINTANGNPAGTGYSLIGGGSPGSPGSNYLTDDTGTNILTDDSGTNQLTPG
jgi:hypothetical protein